MNQKPSPLAALADITPDQADELFEFLRTNAYHVAVKWVDEHWHITVSVSGLRRWWHRETKSRARADLRAAIKVSEQFDKDLDARALDDRAANAIRAALWQAVTNSDVKSIYTLGSLVLDYNADARGGSELEIKAKALAVKERKLDLDREKFEASEARLDAAKNLVSDATLTPEQREAKLKSLFGLK